MLRLQRAQLRPNELGGLHGGSTLAKCSPALNFQKLNVSVCQLVDQHCLAGCNHHLGTLCDRLSSDCTLFSFHLCICLMSQHLASHSLTRKIILTVIRDVSWRKALKKSGLVLCQDGQRLRTHKCCELYLCVVTQHMNGALEFAVAFMLGWGNKPTWLGWGKHHGLGYSNQIKVRFRINTQCVSQKKKKKSSMFEVRNDETVWCNPTRMCIRHTTHCDTAEIPNL